MAAKPIFIGGTGSHVGKSWVATALCRYLYRMGFQVAPFKAQNMSNNSMVCANGGEIGRAQAAQAEACRLAPHPDMNPILLKPTGSFGSQVIVNGRPWKTLKAAEYYEHFDFLLRQVLDSYERLAANYDYVVIEGAGSVTELNLKQRDLVNLGLATRLNAPVILVADIDRGGVFASVIGTFHLLEAEELPLVRSFLVNRFRGDSALFKEGVKILEQHTSRPCLGVFPFVGDVYLDAEDSVSLENRSKLSCAASSQLGASPRVAVIRLPHISNFTDFRLLSNAAYVSHPVEEHFDVIFLPGTKSTIEDMLWLRTSGMERWILEQVRKGSRVVGVCGGFQMLGEEIADPHGVESPTTSVRGLGLIPAKTRLATSKITREVQARTPSGIRFPAYEIHMGITLLREGAGRPFAVLDGGASDGIRLPQATGTYLHGALENKAVLEELLGHSLQSGWSDLKDVQYDRLAGWFSEYVRQDVLATQYFR